MRPMHSRVATAMRVLVRLRPRRRFLAASVVFGLVAGLLVTLTVPTAQAAVPASTPPSAGSAPAPSSTPAASEPRLRREPTLVVAVSGKKAKARLAHLLAVQQRRLQAARATQVRAQRLQQLQQQQAGVLPASKALAPPERALVAQQNKLRHRQLTAQLARQRALAARDEANRRLREALEALAKALSTSSCHTVGGTNGQQASISCPLDDAGSGTGTG